MTSEKSPKVKEISQAEARSHARSALAFMTRQDAAAEMLQTFGDLSAANRRAVMEVMRSEIKGLRPSVDSDRAGQLLLRGLNPGKVTKTEFVSGLVLSTVELAAAVEATDRHLTRQLMTALLSGTTESVLPEFEGLDLARLARSKAVTGALVAFLEHAGEDALRLHVQRWGSFLGQVIAAQGPAVGLSAGASDRILRVIADPALVLPAQLVLATHWLIRLAGGMPEPLTRRQPFSLLFGSDETHAVSASPASGENTQPTKAPVQTQPLRTKRDEIIAVIDAALEDVEKVASERLQVLKDELGKRLVELSSAREALTREEAVSREKSSRIEALEHDVGDQKQRTSELERAMGTLRAEVDQWKREVEVLHGSRQRQLDDARSEVRKELLRSARTHLVSLRGFLLDLLAEGSTAPAQMAGTAFDEFVRVLQKQQYVTPEELPRLNDPSSKAPQ